DAGGDHDPHHRIRRISGTLVPDDGRNGSRHYRTAQIILKRNMNVLILSTILGIVMMFSGLVFKKTGSATYFAVVGILLLLLGGIGDVSGVVITKSTFGGMLNFQGYTNLFIAVVLVSVLFYFLLSGRDIEAVGSNGFDYYALVFFVITGITLCASY